VSARYKDRAADLAHESLVVLACRMIKAHDKILVGGPDAEARGRTAKAKFVYKISQRLSD